MLMMAVLCVIKRWEGIVINYVSGRCRRVLDGVNMESRTVSEDSVADTGAKTTDEESEIEERVARTRWTCPHCLT